MRLVSKGVVCLCCWLFVISTETESHAQINPVRIKVSKVQKKDRKTTFQTSDGQYRHQQVNETVHYNIEVVNFGSSPLSGLRIKWAVIIDPSRAESRGGGSWSWSSANLEVIEGEQACNLQVGAKYVLDTDPVDLSSVTRTYYGGRRDKYGGEVLGYVVDVYVGERLLASETQPSDAKNKIAEIKAKKKKAKD